VGVEEPPIKEKAEGESVENEINSKTATAEIVTVSTASTNPEAEDTEKSQSAEGTHAK